MNGRQHQHWAEESSMLGPGTSEAVTWAGLVIDHARGAYVTDIEGHSYLDLMGGAGVNLIGHSHPDYTAALAKQLHNWMTGAHASAARLAALRGLASLLPPELDRIQFYSGGAEAVESAIRLAKSATGKFEILSFWRGFHGRTAAALALTGGARTGYGPALPGVHTAPYANCYRCPLQTTYPRCGFACVDLARDILREQSSGSLAAVLVEPVQGRAGNVVPPPGYLSALRQLASEYGALLIVDESMTGLGRTGAVLAAEHDQVIPDIAILGKGMGNGYPVSAIVAASALMNAGPFGQPSASSSSFGGFPMACAAVAAVSTLVRENQLVGRADELGAAFLQQLRAQLPERGIVGQVRGKGLALAIELVTDPDTRTPLGKPQLRNIFEDLLHAGILVMASGNTLRIYPPLTVGTDELGVAEEVIGTVIRQWDTTLR